MKTKDKSHGQPKKSGRPKSIFTVQGGSGKGGDVKAHHKMKHKEGRGNLSSGKPYKGDFSRSGDKRSKTFKITIIIQYFITNLGILKILNFLPILGGTAESSSSETGPHDGSSTSTSQT